MPWPFFSLLPVNTRLGGKTERDAILPIEIAGTSIERATDGDKGARELKMAFYGILCSAKCVAQHACLENILCRFVGRGNGED